VDKFFEGLGRAVARAAVFAAAVLCLSALVLVLFFTAAAGR